MKQLSVNMEFEHLKYVIGDRKVYVDKSKHKYPPVSSYKVTEGNSIKTTLKNINDCNAIHSLIVTDDSNIKTFKGCTPRVDTMLVYLTKQFKSFKGFPVSVINCEMYIYNDTVLYATLPQFDKHINSFNISIFEYQETSKAYHNIRFNQLEIYNQIFERFNKADRSRWDIKQIINRYIKDEEKLNKLLHFFIEEGYVRYIPLKILNKINNRDLLFKLQSKHPKLNSKKGLKQVAKIINGDTYGLF